MPLRDLFYISSEYQKMVDWKSLYTSTRLRIPTPNFIVFYNGTEKKEDRWVDYLSESYENMSGEPNLELKVITLNINVGHNKKLMEECQTLREYAQYVDKVRRYSDEMELNTAVERAVSESIQEGILKEFLQKNRAEVVAMSIFEYNEEEEKRKLRKAEYEAGVMSNKKEVAISFAKMGLSVQQIAQGIKEEEKTVRKWLDEKADVVTMSIFEYNEEEEIRKLRKTEYEAGVAEGVMRTKKEAAISLAEMGFSVQQIAQGVKVEEKTIYKWLNEKTDKKAM